MDKEKSSIGSKCEKLKKDSIDNYLHLDILKDGRVKPALGRTLDEKQGNICKKLASFNICYCKRKFIQRRARKDLEITKADVVNIFLNYLKRLDLSKYHGKITYEEICDFYRDKNIIRKNGIMEMYMPM